MPVWLMDPFMEIVGLPIFLFSFAMLSDHALSEPSSSNQPGLETVTPCLEDNRPMAVDAYNPHTLIKATAAAHTKLCFLRRYPILHLDIKLTSRQIKFSLHILASLGQSTTSQQLKVVGVAWRKTHFSFEYSQ